MAARAHDLGARELDRPRARRVDTPRVRALAMPSTHDVESAQPAHRAWIHKGTLSAGPRQLLLMRIKIFIGSCAKARDWLRNCPQ